MWSASSISRELDLSGRPKCAQHPLDSMLISSRSLTSQLCVRGTLERHSTIDTTEKQEQNGGWECGIFVLESCKVVTGFEGPNRRLLRRSNVSGEPVSKVWSEVARNPSATYRGFASTCLSNEIWKYSFGNVWLYFYFTPPYLSVIGCGLFSL